MRVFKSGEFVISDAWRLTMNDDQSPSNRASCLTISCFFNLFYELVANGEFANVIVQYLEGLVKSQRKTNVRTEILTNN